MSDQTLNLEFIEYDLPNGLHCILYQDNTKPNVCVMPAYQVGAKDEIKGQKGIAHLFEHMMFQGSENVSKTGHFDSVMKAGGTCNAFTGFDSTVYFDLLPSNNLELALWLESDRMNSLNITQTNLDNQISVVLEEKKQVIDNVPYGTMTENYLKHIFRGSQYEIPVIGLEEDIKSFSVKEALNFHDNYYSPENCVLMISGDINIEKTKDLILKYFGDIRKKNLINREKNIISELESDEELTVPDNVQLPVVSICFQIPGEESEEDFDLEYFTEIIANRESSRLHRKYVYEKNIFKSVHAEKIALKDAGILILFAMLNPGTDIKLAADILNEEIRLFYDNDINDREFERIKNQLEFRNVTKNLKMNNISIETVKNYMNFRDTNLINTSFKKFSSVTKADIKKTVKSNLLDKKKFTLNYVPKK
ncbi:MAG TPA: pitrilysin family protein [Ignavibacteria bacterium]|nr:pitrilysin family protein [Ignavibacteria bacterium]